MPYFLHCMRCNEDGTYSNVNLECGKCDGTGRDWRKDDELLDFHKWAGLQPHELAGRLNVKVHDTHRGDIWFLYRPRINSVQEDRAEVAANRTRKAEEFDYDYFTEPCQMCLERERTNSRSSLGCGWCEDNGIENLFGYPGKLLRFEADEGYPYFQFPHEDRKFFKDGQELTERQGYAPVHPDCIRPDPRDLHRISVATTDLIKEKYSNEHEPK
ncbi:hypothetical protein EU803_15695 [Loktanella sp. IMCC34160]|nr:hypothetical protein EU803_15695 [Loktanella sp. IMCC34160]